MKLLLIVISLCITHIQIAESFAENGEKRNSPSCRFLPGDSQWPSTSEWEKLNASVSGRLIATIPFGSVCHDPTYNESACQILQQGWSFPHTHFDNPSAFIAAYQQNASCNPYTPRSQPCRLDNYVSYVINVSSAADAAAGIRFARDKNVRLVIKNTGHDYLGKSTGKGGVEFSHYTGSEYTGPAIKMGAGVQTYDAYEAAAAVGLRVLGGECPTVGIAGGFTQGGGHSILSFSYGLSADQVLEWEVVTANGSLVIASPTKNADLYWALSGGGGGTYGVTLSLTAKAHPDGLQSWDAGGQAQWGVFETLFMLSEVTLPGGTEDDVRGLLHPFTEHLNAQNISYQLNVTSLPTFVSHVEHYLGPLPYGVIPSAQIQGGVMVNRTTISAHNSDIINILRNIVSTPPFYFAAFALDVSRPPTHPNAVLPAWRDVLIYYVVSQFWNYTIPFSSMAAQEDILTNKLMPPLQDLGNGAYLSESDFRNPRWKEEFYGGNYERLREVKRRWDGEDLFYATTAVGSDEWVVGGDGRLCRAN
ncbi:putative isoamyl alcohol oxidase [Clohesyomyces aquaticus]|uniref:Putative isoamyl alcohol oxidase n=1 Tax=Clohesyomyces aquaticus TaxID=1231657 RepID=A0A1Y1ZM65_9PLEO|nr:putative isoamyl alcohol oxidase [Clohesyomyces aquaticus]